MTKLELLNKIIISGLGISAVVLAGSRLLAVWPTVPEAPISKSDPFQDVVLEAAAAIVYDPENNEVLFAKNAYEPRPLASITKVMTALVANDLRAAGKLTLPVTEEALQTEGDSGLLRDEVWSISKLIDYTLVSSSNDGAAALAAAAGSSERFVELMNTKAQDLGLGSARFHNPTGLDLAPGQAGAYGSAFDVARLFAYILKTAPATLAATAASIRPVLSLNELIHVAQNTNDLAGRLPGLFAGKTGFTDAAGGNLAVAVDAGLNQPLIIVVLGSSEKGRFTDVEKLINLARR